MDKVTTLCSLWRLSLKDGTIYRFTDHDDLVIFGGETYVLNDSAEAGVSESQAGFSVDTGDIRTRVNLPDLSPQAVREGALDGAKISAYRHDWSDGTTQLLSQGRVGDIRFSENVIEVEWLGQTSLLNRSTGRLFSGQCDAQFGDNRCGLNAADFPAKTNCPRSFDACRDQFDNSANFRGFPHLLGDDVLQAGVGDRDRRDGGSRYA
ncbi:hypothetical protein GCM10011309_01110 [Litorimonas cladophorae]|uniref:Bacteriophage phiJL001 Gp84 C-terminal domain-containing protein n=1 Tax=Litorimonas cladophorae TaxID=1220491 RepID=A0A918N9F7_9PROT|nr:DUF2163 domain-containing protein [Litorimonas cladophorae]GGX56161.1 hypothetical protein GCM10011309_01110 [Litorimonas cladophorae]